MGQQLIINHSLTVRQTVQTSAGSNFLRTSNILFRTTPENSYVFTIGEEKKTSNLTPNLKAKRNKQNYKTKTHKHQPCGRALDAGDDTIFYAPIRTLKLD